LAGIAVGWSQLIGALLRLARTPGVRTVAVRRDSRTLVPEFESRCVAVPREARVVAPLAEDRLFVVPGEIRSIDA
jgi:hypothetical protein